MTKRKSKSSAGFAKKKAKESETRLTEAQRRNVYLLIAAIAVAIVAIVAIPLLRNELAGSGGASAETAAGVISADDDSAPAPVDGARPLAAVPPTQRINYYREMPATAIDTAKQYEAVIVTEKGEIRLALFDDVAPITVNSFVFLARQGYYDGTTFHRVLADFMAQAGDPSGTGAGGPGYQFGDEIDPSLTFDRPGLLAMANAGPGTNGSQFFITYAPTPWLNGNHTIFGEILEGQDVLNALTLRDPTQAPSFTGDIIERIDIVEVSG